MSETPDICPPEITTRQRDIIRCKCADGLTNPATAYQLFISVQTVKSHITKLFKCLKEPSMYRICYRYGRGEFDQKGETA